MFRFAIALTVAWVTSIDARGQEMRLASQATTASRHLDKKQLAVKLESIRADVLIKIMPERVSKKRKRQRRAWLEKYQAIQSDHYLVITNGPRNTVKRFADSLEEIYEFTRKQFPFNDIDSLLTAYIFQTRDEYFDFSVTITGFSRKVAEQTAGHSTGDYYATYYQSPSADTVVHEAAHQIIHRCLKAGWVGSWFQEGLAVYIEKLKNRGNKPSSGMKAALRQGDYYPLEKFFSFRSLLEDAEGHGRRSYAHAGALIDFMVNAKRNPVAGKFKEFMALAGTVREYGKEISAKMIRKIYGLSLQEFETAWKRHYGLKK